MSILTYKLLYAALIGLITVGTGLFFLHFIRKNQHWLSLGDTFADGIFIGVALFHLIPDAADSFSLRAPYGYLAALLIGAVSFLFLFLLEHLIHSKNKQEEAQERLSSLPDAWMFVGILSVHAFLAGLAVGLSVTIATASVLFIAILTHKGFETFALMASVNRYWKESRHSKILLVVFTFITPAGILLASLVEVLSKSRVGGLTIGLFNALAAGTFIFIAFHRRHDDCLPFPSTHMPRYLKLGITLAGIVVMGIIGFWL